MGRTFRSAWLLVATVATVVGSVGCGALLPRSDEIDSAQSALQSCNAAGDCGAIAGVDGCVTITCNLTNHICEKTAATNCCAKVLIEPGSDRNARCNDNNVCTTDTCQKTGGPIELFSHCEYTQANDAPGCCATEGECAATATKCQDSFCLDFSCTYTAKRINDATAEAGCCNSNADCSGGSVCNRTTNLCECAPGQKVCLGANGSESCAVCCEDSDCTLANAEAKCNAGVCDIKACNANFEDCDGTVGNGCEVNLNTDPMNCKECNKVCMGAVGPCELNSCAAGACGVTINPAPPVDIECCNTPAECTGSTACGPQTCVAHACVQPICSDLGTAADMRLAHDLATPPDLVVAAPDLVVVTLPDLAGADLVSLPDLATPPMDLAVTELDLAVPLDDLAVPLDDLAPPVDLASLDATPAPGSDLSAVLDLGRPLSATGGGFGCAASGPFEASVGSAFTVLLALFALRLFTREPAGALARRRRRLRYKG